MNFWSFIWPQIIFVTSSSYNSKIQIKEFLGRKSLVVSGITQSGSIVEDIYKQSLLLRNKLLRNKKIFPLHFPCHSRVSGNLYKQVCSWRNNFMDPRVKPEDDNLRNILILGFGGGSFAKLINKKYPQANIVGVEIDKKIIDIAKKYFQVNQMKNLKLINTDAIDFVAQYHSKFDLIFVDLYYGEEIEKKTETESFLKNLKKVLSKNSLIIFNRLNFKKHKTENERFLEKLKGLFRKVITKKAYSNLIVYCQK